jgi:hypothetical protein
MRSLILPTCLKPTSDDINNNHGLRKPDESLNLDRTPCQIDSRRVTNWAFYCVGAE